MEYKNKNKINYNESILIRMTPIACFAVVGCLLRLFFHPEDEGRTWLETMVSLFAYNTAQCHHTEDHKNKRINEFNENYLYTLSRGLLNCGSRAWSRDLL
jgi:hypothetical protein